MTASSLSISWSKPMNMWSNITQEQFFELVRMTYEHKLNHPCNNQKYPASSQDCLRASFTNVNQILFEEGIKVVKE